ncbi:hypothetical protein Alg215_09549 [Pyrenophora tritici-repentis]|nr:hypothetical protein Alg215_09549 [Pyrenophora tritici-repentis]
MSRSLQRAYYSQHLDEDSTLDRTPLRFKNTPVPPNYMYIAPPPQISKRTNPQHQHILRNKKQPQDLRRAYLHLCQKLQTKLPRELRDRIYKHYFNDRTSVDYSEEYYAHAYGVLTKYKENVQINPPPPTTSTAKEASEYYLATETYFVRDTPSLIRDLKTDYFNLGLTLCNHVRNLRITLCFDDLAPMTPAEFGEDDDNSASDDDTSSEKGVLCVLHKRLTRAFSLIPASSAPFTLILNFAPEGYIHYPSFKKPNTKEKIGALNIERRMLNVLETIRMPVYDFIHAGENRRVKPVWEDSAWNQEHAVHSDIFFLNKEEWEKLSFYTQKPLVVITKLRCENLLLSIVVTYMYHHTQVLVSAFAPSPFTHS